MARIASHPDLINADCRALARLVRDDIAEYKDPGHAVIRGDAPGWDEVVAAIWRVADHAPVT